MTGCTGFGPEGLPVELLSQTKNKEAHSGKRTEFHISSGPYAVGGVAGNKGPDLLQGQINFGIEVLAGHVFQQAVAHLARHRISLEIVHKLDARDQQSAGTQFRLEYQSQPASGEPIVDHLDNGTQLPGQIVHYHCA